MFRQLKDMREMVNAAPGLAADAQQLVSQFQVSQFQVSQFQVSQFQVSQLQPGRTLLATVDPPNPAAIWLDFGSL
jgi:hypothetical protein